MIEIVHIRTNLFKFFFHDKKMEIVKKIYPFWRLFINEQINCKSNLIKNFKLKTLRKCLKSNLF